MQVWHSSTRIVHYACAVQRKYDVMRLTAYMVHKPKTEREGLVHFITWMMSVSTHDVVFTSYSGYSCLTFLSEKSAHLPLQVVPLLASWNPVLHSQRKDPGSFTHLWSHPPLVLSHSLMSGEKRENKRTIQPSQGHIWPLDRKIKSFHC